MVSHIYIIGEESFPFLYFAYNTAAATTAAVVLRASRIIYSDGQEVLFM